MIEKFEGIDEIRRFYKMKRCEIEAQIESKLVYDSNFLENGRDKLKGKVINASWYPE